MTREVLVELPADLTADFEADKAEAPERSEFAQAVAATITVASLGANLATIAVAREEVRDIARRLRASVLRRTPPSEPSIQLVIRVASGGTSLELGLTRGDAGSSEEAEIEALVAALLKAFADSGRDE